MRRVIPEIGEEVRVMGQLEKFAANFHGAHLDIPQLRSEVSVPYGTGRRERLIVFIYQTVHSNDNYKVSRSIGRLPE